MERRKIFHEFKTFQGATRALRPQLREDQQQQKFFGERLEPTMCSFLP